MAFIREKKHGSKVYFYLVETYRVSDGKPRQRVVKYFGLKRPHGRQKGLKPKV
ncbi:hypothetical protein ES703_46069 [subsurface metagenome]